VTDTDYFSALMKKIETLDFDTSDQNLFISINNHVFEDHFRGLSEKNTRVNTRLLKKIICVENSFELFLFFFLFRGRFMQPIPRPSLVLLKFGLFKWLVSSI